MDSVYSLIVRFKGVLGKFNRSCERFSTPQIHRSLQNPAFSDKPSSLAKIY